VQRTQVALIANVGRFGLIYLACAVVIGGLAIGFAQLTSSPVALPGPLIFCHLPATVMAGEAYRRRYGWTSAQRWKLSVIYGAVGLVFLAAIVAAWLGSGLLLANGVALKFLPLTIIVLVAMGSAFVLSSRWVLAEIEARASLQREWS
jgi:hypothetical protein